jgi:serine protease Do
VIVTGRAACFRMANVVARTKGARLLPKMSAGWSRWVVVASVLLQANSAFCLEQAAPGDVPPAPPAPPSPAPAPAPAKPVEPPAPPAPSQPSQPSEPGAAKPAAPPPAPPPATPKAAPAGAPAAAAAKPASPPATPPAPSAPDPRDAIVRLERAGVLIALGSVLTGDGRVLTALSPLGDGNHIDARFADNSVVPLRVGYTDRGWDLALLVPQSGGWTKGLRPSRLDPTATTLVSYTAGGAQKLVRAQVLGDGVKTLLGGDSALLPDALVLKSRFRDSDIGGPLLDQNNDVIGVLARACVTPEKAPCTRSAYGVPVSAIKAFLKRVPHSASLSAVPWIGLKGVAAKEGPVSGVRVQQVDPEGPAAEAGVRGATTSEGASGTGNAADIIVAVNDVAVTTPEALDQAVRRLGVGDTAQFLLYRAGKFRQASLTLRAAPRATPIGASASPAQVPGPSNADKTPQ